MNRISSYESIIIDVLKREKIQFEREKQFRDLRNGLYRFDFYLPKLNMLIEVDGEQHFRFTKKFFKKKEQFLKAQERDRQKNSYSLAHDISLYRIPYWEIKQIHYFLDIIQDKHLVKDKWHNDNLKVPKN